MLLSLTFLAPVNPDRFYQNGSALLVQAYPGCPRKRPLNECSSSSLLIFAHYVTCLSIIGGQLFLVLLLVQGMVASPHHFGIFCTKF